MVPVHDAEATLDDALADICAQTMTDFEALIVLNGITDASETLARRWAADDRRLRLLVLEDADLVNALNAGLDAARAPLVARFDADDRMAPTRLARQVAAMNAHPDWALTSAGVHVEAVDGGPAGPGMARLAARLNGLTTPAAIRAARFIDVPVVHPAVIFRAERVRSLGGYRAGDFGEDHDLWLRMLARGDRFGMVDETLVTWRDHAARYTRTNQRLRQDACRALVLRHLVDGPLSGGRASIVWGGGRCGRRYARDLRRVGGTVDAIVDIDPAKVGRIVAGGVPIIAADTLGPPDGRLVLV
ncbi:MAG: glycosyltransferase, partial [Myxococcota bacterium]|nr:glycosyltransferase [Myxococcota bacterium]